MTPGMAHNLDILGNESVRVASRKHDLARSSSKVKRKKVKKSDNIYQIKRSKSSGRGRGKSRKGSAYNPGGGD